MDVMLRSFAAFLFCLAGCGAPQSGTAPAGPARTVIAGVNVIDVAAGEIVPDSTIIIEGEKIAQIVPAADYAGRRDDRVIDMTGAYALPGLVEMHAHLIVHLAQHAFAALRQAEQATYPVGKLGREWRHGEVTRIRG